MAEDSVVEDPEVYIEETLNLPVDEPAVKKPTSKPLNQTLANETDTPEDEELGVEAEQIDELYPDRKSRFICIGERRKTVTLATVLFYC